jgi:Domain of unknown function (DUF4328)
MTLSGSNSPQSQPDHPDITELAKTILEGERRPLVERPTPPQRRIRLDALKSLRLPAAIVQLALASCVVLGVVAIVFGFVQRSLLHRVVSNPAGVTFAELLADQHRADAINGLFLAAQVTTGVAFLVWFWRAYRNLDALDLPRRYGTGWAVGGWFVPFLNFVRPKQVADDIWASVNDAHPGGSALLGFWWAAWIASGAASFLARQGDNHTVNQALTTNALFLARDALFAIAAVLAFFVVRRLTRAQMANR